MHNNHDKRDACLATLHGRSIVMVGLMGAGKSTVGKKIAQLVSLPFIDADREIETAAGCNITDFFALYGEAEFRRGEERVMKRLLNTKQCVLATGGGAFMSPETRKMIADKGISVWLYADLEILYKRTIKRGGRPLLIHANPKHRLEQLMQQRNDTYALADIHVRSTNEAVEHTAHAVVNKLLACRPPSDKSPAS